MRWYSIRRHLDDKKKYVPEFVPEFILEFVPEFVPEFDQNTDFYSGTNSEMNCGMNSGTKFFMSSKLRLTILVESHPRVVSFELNSEPLDLESSTKY